MESHFELVPMPKWILWSFRFLYKFNLMFERFVGLRVLYFCVKSNSYKISKFSLLYFVTFGISIIIAFPLSVVHIVRASMNYATTNHFIAIVILLIMMLYSLLVFIMFTLHLLYLKRRQLMLNQSIQYFEETKTILQEYQSDLKTILVLVFIRVAVCEICSFSASIVNIFDIVKNVDYNLFIYFVIISTPYILQTTTLTNFYAGVLRIYFHFRQINRNLELTMKKMKDSHELTEYQKITLCCELSDFIDRLAIHHRTLCDSAKELVSLYSIQILFCLMISFFGIVFQAYYAMVIARLYLIGALKDFTGSFSGLFFVMSTFIELFLQGVVSTKLDVESRRTGRLLHRISVMNADIRFEKSMVATIVSYMIIMVQFDQNIPPAPPM
ncbi:hypothetical protein DMENIID0001_029890 [Sergentomyia squamirostris]